jgi:hypothetical protein
MPWVPDTSSLGFFRDGTEISAVQIDPASPAFIEPPMAERDREHNRVTLKWTAPDAEGAVLHMVRYSNDAGETWRAVTAGLTKSEVVIDVNTLPGGAECLFQIVTYSETLRTSTAKTALFSVEVEPRHAYILSPEPGTGFAGGSTVSLRGTGYSVDFGTASNDDISWTSNVDGFLGYGADLLVNSLSQGIHSIRLDVADGLGRDASTSVRIAIGPRQSAVG